MIYRKEYFRVLTLHGAIPYWPRSINVQKSNRADWSGLFTWDLWGAEVITILRLSFHFQFDAIAKYFSGLMTRKEISGSIITFSSCFTRWGLLLGFPFPRHPFPFSRRPISPRGSNAQLLDFNVVLSTSNTFLKNGLQIGCPSLFLRRKSRTVQTCGDVGISR